MIEMNYIINQSIFRRRVYFQDVHILLPRTWSQAAHSLPTWQRADGGDVRVKPWQSVGPGLVEDTPFTLKATSCGFPGQFLHLTPRYLLDDTVAANFGPYDKVGQNCFFSSAVLIEPLRWCSGKASVGGPVSTPR